MSAVLVKGIIISLSVVAAVGIALQSPEVRDWIDEQRRRLAEMLRSMSDGLDPHTRSQAEAFAFGGRMPTQQSTPSATATSLDTTNDTLRHRSQAQTSHTPIDAAERRRLGREYLAKRNQELLELRNKRHSEMTERSSSTRDTTESLSTIENTIPSQSDTKTVEDAVAAGSFIELINNDGTLRLADAESTSSRVSRAFDSGSSFANPFGDEYALSEQSEALPPVPPKISHEDPMPGSYPSEPAAAEHLPSTDEVSSTHDEDYNTQLARALSLSLAETEEHSRTALHRQMSEEEQFELAIRNSLSETQRISTSSNEPAHISPLVDLSSDDPTHAQSQRTITNPWQASSDDDDLYFLTPTPTGAPVQSIENMLSSAHAFGSESAEHEAMPASSSHTLSPALIPSLTPKSMTLSPSTTARDTLSTGFQSDTDSEEFASLSGSVARSTGSLVEVEDVDIDSMSDDDGIRTPQSWSEVGSEVAESEHSENSTDSVVRV